MPINADTKAWRQGKVILCGPNVKYAKSGDIICFPNNLGIPISNIHVKGHGILKKGIFINEQRIFGICEELNNNESKSITSKKSSRK